MLLKHLLHKKLENRFNQITEQYLILIVLLQQKSKSSAVLYNLKTYSHSPRFGIYFILYWDNMRKLLQNEFEFFICYHDVSNFLECILDRKQKINIVEQ